MPLPAGYLLFREQHIRHGDGAKSSLADEASIIGALFRLDIDVDVNVANGPLPRGVALGWLNRVRRKDQVHIRNPALRTERRSIRQPGTGTIGAYCAHEQDSCALEQAHGFGPA